MSRGDIARTVQAEVIGYWVGTQRVLLRTLGPAPHGFEAWAPPELAHHLVTGVHVTVYYDAEDRILGWYLPGPKLGTREDLGRDG